MTRVKFLSKVINMSKQVQLVEIVKEEEVIKVIVEEIIVKKRYMNTNLFTRITDMKYQNIFLMIAFITPHKSNM